MRNKKLYVRYGCIQTYHVKRELLGHKLCVGWASELNVSHALALERYWNRRIQVASLLLLLVVLYSQLVFGCLSQELLSAGAVKGVVVGASAFNIAETCYELLLCLDVSFWQRPEVVKCSLVRGTSDERICQLASELFGPFGVVKFVSL